MVRAIFGEQSATIAAHEIAGRRASRYHQRHRDHACGKAAKESDDEIQSRRKQENRSLASGFVLLKSRRERAGVLMQLRESDAYVSAAAFGHEDKGRRVRPFLCSQVEQFDQ